MYRSWIPTPPILYLRFAAYLTIGLAQDSRPSGSLVLTRKALSSSTPCRFIPAHKHLDYTQNPLPPPAHARALRAGGPGQKSTSKPSVGQGEGPFCRLYIPPRQTLEGGENTKGGNMHPLPPTQGFTKSRPTVRGIISTSLNKVGEDCPLIPFGPLTLCILEVPSRLRRF
jgi:hypothetical protein